MYDFDVGQAQEVTFSTSGGLGEWETSGLVMNIVPKSGGNTMHGSLFASGTGDRLQSDNLTPDLIGRGVRPAAPYAKVYDVSATLGGSIVTDRLWYFLGAHTGGSTRNSTNVYYNRNAGDAGAWRYVPDPDRPAYSDRTFEKRERPAHVAGDAAQQSGRLLGRTDHVPGVHGRDAGPVGAAAELAGSGRRARTPPGCDAGHLVVARAPIAC